MSSVATIGDASGVLDTIKGEIEQHVGYMAEITGWCDEQLGALATGGLAGGEMGSAVELFKSRIEGIAEGMGHITIALNGAIQVAELVGQH